MRRNEVIMHSPRYTVVDQVKSSDHCVPVTSFKGWQVQAYNMMQSNSWPLNMAARTVNLVYDDRGYTGKHTFIKSLLQSDSHRFLIIHHNHGEIRIEDLAKEARKAKERGWNGDSCIIVAVIEGLDGDSCRALEMASEGLTVVKYEARFAEYWQPVNVWVFTRRIPNLLSSIASVWRVFTMEKEPHNRIPDMREISFVDSLEMFCSVPN